jgi:outer membrane lipoprotein-sorting protein
MQGSVSRIGVAAISTLAFFALSFASAPAASNAALDAFAKAWSGLHGYNATIQLFEAKGGNSEHAVFAYSFTKPTTVTMHVNQGPNSGATVKWTGGPSVYASKSGAFGITMGKNVSINDSLVTSLRGYTVSDLSFAGILAHAQQTAGSLSSGTTKLDGATVTAVTLNVANPSEDNGMTREVLYLSQSTQLPVRVDGFVGNQVVRMYRFTITKSW